MYGRRKHESLCCLQEATNSAAWCTGAAQDLLQLAAQEGAQLFCSGEYAERTYHEALETGCAYMVCGHHATERAGIRALGEHLTVRFALPVRFFDEGNPF